jgi:hypothetical protein
MPRLQAHITILIRFPFLGEGFEREAELHAAIRLHNDLLDGEAVSAVTGIPEPGCDDQART